MIRILEVLVSLVIVFALAVLIGVLLPSHGHVTRVVEVSSPVRQVYDTLNTFRRFPQWSAFRGLDPQTQFKVEGPDFGPGSKVSWTSSNARVGSGEYEITKSEQDSKIEMSVKNHWTGENKKFTIDLEPSANGKTLKIRWGFDADYGWDLLARYAGLYIYGDPAQTIQSDLNNVAAILAGFPNTDYKDQKIDLVDVTTKPVLLVATKAKRSLDDVAEATDTAVAEIEAVMKKAGLTAAGPTMTITTNWGDEDYAFSIAIPVDNATFTLDKHDFTIDAPTPKPSDTQDDSGDGEEKTLNPGDRDEHGLLVIGGNVRAAQWYQGKALMSEYTGSPASLPLYRLNLKAYAETHGYRYAETGLTRFWDENVSAPDAPAGEESFKVYLPIQQ
ncbi:SRPBCC family protein [Dokdonella sp.]|uniref:SRPBCC family protein n=1 Tax=Dokdonella sp. TaxID=2291710 RepID=UPI001B1D879E|nr:SRPBCC family protein [Dokdonella sp.]MBO9664830.1 SRPBCC family protein [Dokdonella sp.]